jgi:hypothetical protein
MGMERETGEPLKTNPRIKKGGSYKTYQVRALRQIEELVLVRCGDFSCLKRPQTS